MPFVQTGMMRGIGGQEVPVEPPTPLLPPIPGLGQGNVVQV